MNWDKQNYIDNYNTKHIGIGKWNTCFYKIFGNEENLVHAIKKNYEILFQIKLEIKIKNMYTKMNFLHFNLVYISEDSNSRKEKRRMKDNMTLLVTEAKKGSQEAYEALYQKTKQMVYFTCFGLLKSEADAADQMQEAYAAAFQKLDMLDDPEKFPGWINRIAINKCKDFLIQKKQWLPLSEETDIPVQALETEEDFLPEAYIMKESTREIVQQIMQKELSDVQYRTILLYYYDGLSLSEIAEWMECSEGTVKSRLHNAKELIREGVQKYEQKHDDKLYSIAALPFFAQLLQMQAEKLRAPEFNPDNLQNTKGQTPAYQQSLKQATKLKQGKGRLQMGQKGLFSTTAGKILTVSVTLLIIVGGIAGISTIFIHSGQRNDNQENNRQETDTNGADGRVETDDSEIEDFISQISFIDAETGEDYLSGHIMSIIQLDYDNFQYLVLDDKHNIYMCTQQSDVSDIYQEGNKIQWYIELLYEDVKLDTIEELWTKDHYNLYTGTKEAGADGHEKCMFIYGNGYIYRDGEEYNLNDIVPVDKLSIYMGLGTDNIFIIDTSGNLHYWQGGQGLDAFNTYYSEFEQVGFLDYFEAPLCEELRQTGICVDLGSDGRVLLSDGRLVVATSPMSYDMQLKAFFNLDAYTFEERTALEGVKALHSGGWVIEDTERNIHLHLIYSSSTSELHEEIVTCDFGGEILDINILNPNGLMVLTTEGYYSSRLCHGFADNIPVDVLDPFRKLSVLSSTPSPIKEFVNSLSGSVCNFKNSQFLFLLEDGTVWGFINGEYYDGY